MIKTVVVLGMHRSGTSVVASILMSLCVDIGKNLSPTGAQDNPLGHFENLDFQELNMKLLEAAKGDWTNPPSKEEITQAATAMSAEIEQTVQKNMGPLWGFKDPRTALTIHVLAPFLPNLHIVYTMRGAQAIANSLFKRGNIPHSYATVLNNIYNERINSFLTSSRIPYIRVDYDELIAHPDAEVKKVVDFLRLTPSEAQLREAIGRVRTDQRHWG